MKDMGWVECKRCGKTVRRKRWKQKFCSASCKVADWQEKTGYKEKYAFIVASRRKEKIT